MPKSRTFTVKNGRIFFKCPICQLKKMVTVVPGLRRRTIFCSKCGEKIFCILDRREMKRTSQSGRVLLLAGTGKTEVSLFDISVNGAGFELDTRSAVKVAIGARIELQCHWNPLLFPRRHYVVRSVRGFKVGAERLN